MSSSKSASLKTYVLRGISGIFMLRVAGTALGLALSVVLARLMGPTEYGRFAFATETMLFLTIPVALGLPNLLVREVARLQSEQKHSTLKGMIIWASRFVTVIGLITTAAAAVIIWFAVHDASKRSILLFALPIVLLNGLGHVRMGALRGLRRPVLSQLPDAVLRPGITLLLVALAYWAFSLSIDARIGVIGMTAALFVSLVLGSAWLKSSVPAEVRNEGLRPSFEANHWIKEAWPFFLLGGIGLINARLGVVLTGFFLEAEEVAYIKIAVTASMLVSFLLTAVNSTIAPVIAELHLSGQTAQLQRILTKTVRGVFIVSLVMAILYVTLGQQLITLFYGETYGSAYVPLLILTLGQLVNAGAGSVAYVLNMTGHQRDTVKGQAISAVSAIVLSIVLIPWIGIVGAAIATSASLIIWNFVLLSLLRRRSPLRTTIL